eukprot:6213753-Pleurochrysis_carterae.AAC.4
MQYESKHEHAQLRTRASPADMTTRKTALTQRNNMLRVYDHLQPNPCQSEGLTKQQLACRMRMRARQGA